MQISFPSDVDNVSQSPAPPTPCGSVGVYSLPVPLQAPPAPPRCKPAR